MYAERRAYLQSRPPPSAAVMAAAPAVQKIHVNVRLIRVRDTMEQYANGWHALNEVNTNACEETHILKEQE